MSIVLIYISHSEIVRNPEGQWSKITLPFHSPHHSNPLPILIDLLPMVVAQASDSLS